MKFRQTTGQMTSDEFGVQGYSGNGKGLNNPAMQQVHGVGPLPQGDYTIARPHTDPKLGPIAMRLVPASVNEMFGRGGFFIHGDNAAMNHTGSEGCIVMSKEARTTIAEAVLRGETHLTVSA